MDSNFLNKMLFIWEKMKARSSWHFDTLREPVAGKDSFTHICCFKTEWKLLADNFINSAKQGEWKIKEEKNSNKKGDYGDVEVLPITDTSFYPTLSSIINYLGLEQVKVNFLNEKPGKKILLHTDNLAVKFADDPELVQYYLDNPDKIRRFVIMMYDWSLGQVFQLGNANWYQWRAGECITWEWKDIPHSTCNMGWENRPMLQITGLTTEKTKQVLLQASKNLIVEI